MRLVGLAAILLAVTPLLAAAPAAAEAEPEPASQLACDGKPVIMMVRGRIHDMARLRAYGQALADSGLYDRLGGYYLIAPRAIDVFEGAVPANESILLARFPCLAHARAFWNSRAYQEQVKPKRLDPSAGDFIVSVYPEVPPPAYMAGRVIAPDYTPAIPETVLPEQK